MAGSGKIVPSIDFIDLKENMPNLDAMVNSTDLTFTNRDTTNGNVTTRTLAGINAAGDQAIAAIANVSIGLYLSDPTFNNRNEYVNFDRSGTNETYRLKSTTPTPYQVNSVATPDPLNDASLQPFAEVTASDIVDYTDIKFDSVQDMITWANDPVNVVTHKVGNKYTTAGMAWVVNSVSGTVVIADFKPITPVDLAAFVFNEPLALTDQTLDILSAIESLPNGSKITCNTPVTVLVSKPVGYRSDIYGTDGRNYSGLVWNGAQPCLPIIEKLTCEFDFSNVEFVVDNMGQGGIDLYKCQDTTTTHAGTWIPKFARDNPSSKSLWFPPVDGNTGFAEKGTNLYGFNTTVLTPDIGGARNSMFVTLGESSGGYGGLFPQDGGGTAATWGQWRGGEIGSYGDAITIIGGKNNKILDYNVTGFNGVAVAIGLARGIDGTAHARIDPLAEEFVPVNTSILGGESNYCYIGNIQRNRYRGLTIRDTKGYYSGHPDWDIGNTINSVTPQVDPGYGIASGRFSPQFNALIENNEHLYCARKGFDSHNGNYERVYNNRFIGGVWGGQIAIEDTLQDATDTENRAQVYALDVKDNTFEGGLRGLDTANGAFGRGPREALGDWWLKLKVNIAGNTIRGPSGWYYNYGHSPFNLVDNEIEFANRYDIFTPFPSTGTFAFTHGSLGTRGPTTFDIIKGNRIRNSLDGNFQYSYYWYNSSWATIKDNYADVTPFSLGDGVDMYTTTNASAHRLGVMTNGSISAGGTAITDATHENNIFENVISDVKTPFTNVQSSDFKIHSEALNYSTAGWPISQGGVARTSRLGFVRFRAGYSVALKVRLSFLTANGSAASSIAEEHSIFINQDGTSILAYEDYSHTQAAGSVTTFALGTLSAETVELRMTHTSTMPYSNTARSSVIVEWVGGDFYRNEVEL